jgi:hypothetical protein
MGYAQSHFLSYETKSLMTIRQLTVDHAKANKTINSLAQMGRRLFKADINSPKIERGIRQYPMTLIAWNSDL